MRFEPRIVIDLTRWNNRGGPTINHRSAMASTDHRIVHDLGSSVQQHAAVTAR